VATLSLPGLATGIDTTAIITQLIAAERQPENLLKAQQTTVSSESSAFTTLAGDVDTLKPPICGPFPFLPAETAS
jgi:flagellar hook-associated protein 2